MTPAHQRNRLVSSPTAPAMVIAATGVCEIAGIGTHAAALAVLTEEVTRVEGRSDELHDQGIKALYQAHGHADPMRYLIGREIYENLERVVDRFEDVANEISGIVIENV